MATTRLRSNISWLLIGTIAFAGAQWASLAALAKLGGTEVVGRYTLGLAVCAPVFVFFSMHLRRVVSTDTDREYSTEQYLLHRIAATCVSLILVALIAIVVLRATEQRFVTLFVGLVKAVEALSLVLYGSAQRNGRAHRVGKSFLLKALVTGCLFPAVYWLTGHLVLTLAIQAFSYGIIFGSYDVQAAIGEGDTSVSFTSHFWELARRIQTAVSAHGNTVISITRLAIPLGILASISSLSANVPRYFLEGMLSTSAVGVYASIDYLGLAGDKILTAIGEATSPKLAEQHSAGNTREFRRLAANLLLVAGVVAAAEIFAAVLFGKTILRIAFNAEIAQYSTVFVLMMVAASLRQLSLVLQYLLTARRSLRQQAVASLSAFTLVTVGCIGFVPVMGIGGAAIARVVSALSEAAVNARQLLSRNNC